MTDGLRTFVEQVDELGELETLRGVDWDRELGAITEVVAEKGGGLGGPALLFDDIEGYPSGYRVLTNGFGSVERSRLALNAGDSLSPLDVVDEWRRGIRSYEGNTPTTIDRSNASLTENVQAGPDVDVTAFPVPKWHDVDGGRYIGTGCAVVTRDPDSGWVNLGVYRSMIVDAKTVSVWVAPGKDARVTMERYHERGESCPLALVAGLDPRTWIAATLTAKRGESEYDIAGWLRDEAVRVVEGESTGLSLPADAEIVLEGWVPPLDERSCVDGPFGEWPGYATEAHANTPVLEVERVYHRNDPILLGQPPLKPPSVYTVGIPVRTAGGVWNQLEAAGVPGVTGVWSHVIERPQFLVVAVDTQYRGHGKQVAMAASSVPSGVFNGRYVVVVDDDVDITNLEEVVWAMCTRCPADEIDIVDGVYTSPLDPTLADRDDNRSSRALIDATRPYGEPFPPVNRFDDDYRREVTERWGLDVL